MKPRWLLLCGLIFVALVIAGVLLSWRASIPEIAPPPRSAFSTQDIARGRALAAVGDCMTCHTTQSGRPFAGGRPIPTPFGVVFSTNITPDRKMGIGRWSIDAFRRAMRQGIARDGTHLYPAFPYDHFAQTRGSDIAELYAYLMTREPVSAPALHDRLLPPFDIRALLAGWNFLYFHRSPFRADRSKSAAWNRGAYLVETLGHCGACHTPHSAFGAEKTNRALDGAMAEGWYAPPLDARSSAPVPWTVDELSTYLRTGVDDHHGGAAGPMRRVTRSLHDAPSSDVSAMATYLASLMPRRTPSRRRMAATDSQAAAIFVGACAACHDSSRWPPLGDSTTLTEHSPRDTLEILLHGIPWRADGLYMPPFAATLDDAQVADLANSLRARFAGRAPWSDAEAQARRIRKEIPAR
ncbi:MAG: c-type cytochrome [Rhizomicrobium sp.]